MVIGHNCGFCVAHTLHDVYSFIKALQHRGREAAGIAFIGDNRIDVIKWAGNVSRFDITDLYTMFPSKDYHTYLAHVRYATQGKKDKILQEAHPHVIGGNKQDKNTHIIISDCEAVMVHNGQVNIESSNNEEKSDTEKLLELYAEKGAEEILHKIPGAYTLAAAKKGGNTVVMRDKLAMKPGALGWKDGKHIVSSEDIAFRKNGGKFIEDLRPGYIYNITPGGDYYRKQITNALPKHCFFEWNYIAGVESTLDGISVRRIREVLGARLAQEFPLDIDFVTFLPRCPEVAARIYAEKRGVPFIDVFYKTRGERSFLGSTAEERNKSISNNLFVLPEVNGRNIKDILQGKTIAIIDDSMVRGNNSKKAIELLKQTTNVKHVHFINYTPQIGIIPEDKDPRGCLYGVDMPPTDNFIARNKTSKEINEEIGAEVHFLSKEGMLKAFETLGIPRENLCHYCIGGKKPF